MLLKLNYAPPFARGAVMTADPEQIARDEAFCAEVWGALKGDHTDLRKQAIILEAHRRYLQEQSNDGR